jgi:hypothetical protein
VYDIYNKIYKQILTFETFNVKPNIKEEDFI